MLLFDLFDSLFLCLLYIGASNGGEGFDDMASDVLKKVVGLELQFPHFLIKRPNPLAQLPVNMPAVFFVTISVES